MGTLIVFVMCAMYGMGLIILPAMIIAITIMLFLNKYCEKKFGESLFNFNKGDKA